MLKLLHPDLNSWLAEKRSDAAWLELATDLLVRMVSVDTTPKPDPAQSAAAEGEIFGIIREFLSRYAPSLRVREVPIDERIARHPYYSIPYYSAGNCADAVEAVRAVYRGRSNLLAGLERRGAGPVLALNAHVDTVPPHIEPRVQEGVVSGRGAADDKGSCLSMMLAAALIEEIRTRFGVAPPCGLLFEFVIDEEPGGNGSLSLALDKERAAFDSIVVGECTDFHAHPANRGAVWYLARLKTTSGRSLFPLTPKAVLLGAATFAVGSMEVAGRKLKQESRHPLFPDRPVQTCHGRIGPCGEHPSRVHDHVTLMITWDGGDTDQDIQPLLLKTELAAVVYEALAEYCTIYGDKTWLGLSERVLERHILWSDVSPLCSKLEVFGISGHMGSIDQLDGAITKACHIVRKLIRLRHTGRSPCRHMRIELADEQPATELVLEGGQGFLPTHDLEDVCARLRAAVDEGLKEYERLCGLDPGTVTAEVSFDKLHNAAFARPPDGPAMKCLLQATHDAGVGRAGPVRGWKVSCDARIFAREFPDAEIITFGAGDLAAAHSAGEHVRIADVVTAAEVLARMALGYGESSEDKRKGTAQ